MKYKGTPRTKIVLRRRRSEGNKLRYIRKKENTKRKDLNLTKTARKKRILTCLYEKIVSLEKM